MTMRIKKIGYNEQNTQTRRKQQQDVSDRYRTGNEIVEECVKHEKHDKSVRESMRNGIECAIVYYTYKWHTLV